MEPLILGPYAILLLIMVNDIKLVDNSRTLLVKHADIGHFGKYHNTLCLSPQSLHKHCFCFLLGPLYVPRGTGNNAYVKFGGQTKNIMVFSEVAYYVEYK